MKKAEIVLDHADCNAMGFCSENFHSENDYENNKFIIFNIFYFSKHPYIFYE